MFRHLPGTRLWLPEPLTAWAMIGLGVVVIAIGTLCAVRVRSHMWSTTGNGWTLMVNINRETVNYWLHEYEEPDKWVVGLGMALRIPAGLLTIWGVFGLAWA